MKFQIKNRWTGAVQFECELTAEVAGMSYGLQLGFAVKQAIEAKANLRAANLSAANLSDANLRAANLRDADLRDADLSDADLSDVYASDWIPRIPNIHQAVLEAASKPGALDMGMWHKTDYCGTTHCRAGWVVALAGMPGRVLEGCMGTPAAAALIYQASDPSLDKVPNFYCDNAMALEDMQRLAAAERDRVTSA